MTSRAINVSEMKLNWAIPFFILVLGAQAAFANPYPALDALPTDIRIADKNFPSIGKWLLDHDEAVAHWLGEIVTGRTIDEPINALITVSAKDPEEAGRKLISVAKKAGFRLRGGHTVGYSARSDEALWPEFPGAGKTTFSDCSYLLNNNHGRAFGPVPHDGKFIFLMAVSREKVNYIAGALHGFHAFHEYAGFNRARDAFARKLIHTGKARAAGSLDLANVIDTADETTGDHDGLATWIEIP
jgi:hypothetical protein